MATKHTEERLFAAVHDIEVSALDAGREFAHHMYDLVPTVATDLTKVTDASFDFVGSMLELRLDVARKLVKTVREAEAPTPAVRKPTSAPKKLTTAKKAA